MSVDRRTLIVAGVGAAWPPGHAAAAQAAGPSGASVEAALRRGGVVIAFRHALAPGTYDPPDFRLGDCSTQRNLSEEGRAQARRIGAWFEARGMKPARVRSSPWCRCVDTAQLAFGQAEPWAALGSPRGASETTNAESLEALRRAVSARRDGFEVWVTHMFVLSALVGGDSASGEGLLLRDVDGVVAVQGRLSVP